MRVRENKEWGRKYITWFSELEESKEEAREEGELLHLIKAVYKKMLKSKTNCSKAILANSGSCEHDTVAGIIILNDKELLFTDELQENERRK